MRKIDKRQVPDAWREYAATEGAVYEAKPELRLSLLQEQGYLCAYCMQRIDYEPGATTDTRIEHVISQSDCLANGTLERTLDYGNMVLCCNGLTNGAEHCDRFKGERSLSFSPTDSAFISTLSYGSQGDIKSSDRQYDRELNEYLNLNAGIIRKNRAKTLKGVIGMLEKKKFSSRVLRQQLSNWTERDADGRFKAYSGIVIYYLEKKLRSRN